MADANVGLLNQRADRPGSGALRVLVRAMERAETLSDVDACAAAMRTVLRISDEHEAEMRRHQQGAVGTLGQR